MMRVGITTVLKHEPGPDGTYDENVPPKKTTRVQFFTSDYLDDAVVDVTADEMTDALAAGINRFREMQEEAIAELRRLGLLHDMPTEADKASLPS